MQDELKFSVQGHVKITSYADSEGSDPVTLLDKRNAVHKENRSIAVARAMAARDDGHVYSMHFGTGGATIDGLGNVIYASPNVEGSADLNVPVYYEVVDQDRGAPTGNQMAARHIAGTLFADVEIRCVIDKNEPVGQLAFDSGSVNLDEDGFTFDEIGIKTDDGLLLTHIVFSPIVKAANRVVEVIYTLRFRIE